ncbi:hypothetical protein PINS_up009683 [Pythium insidiosum]|nr:hypothetical protein PINS_up009683 [Pythium insidiosum]
MPAGFVWTDMDLSDDAQVREVYELLTQNYVEDDSATLRFDYSVDLLRWAMTPPGYRKDWLVGVRNAKNNKLMAFISGIPVKVRAYEHTMEMAEINFLCVHKKLRAKRLAPVLIKEITRRVNLQNIWQAVYTAGAVLPMPVSQCRYYHRSLNPKKLIEVGFSPLPPRMTISSVVKMLRLPTTTSTPGLRPMEPKDVPRVTALLAEYLSKHQLVTHYSEEEVAHWMLPRAGVLSSYVVENPTTHEVTDFCSFYSLPSFDSWQRQAQATARGVLVLQRRDVGRAERFDAGRAHSREERWLRRLQRADDHGQREFPRAAQVRQG